MLSPSVLVIAALLVVQVSCQFNRRCEYPSDCQFRTPSSGRAPPFSMECRGGSCRCKSVPLMDAPNWDLKLQSGKCLVGDGGPCGSDRGLNIHCTRGLKCIGDRCRNPSSVGKGKDGEYCMADIDCLPTLRCAVVRFSYQPTRNCKPKNFKDNYTRSK